MICQNFFWMHHAYTIFFFVRAGHALNFSFFAWEAAGYVFTFGGAKRSGSDRECKYFPIGMNAREPLWR